MHWLSESIKVITIHVDIRCLFYRSTLYQRACIQTEGVQFTRRLKKMYTKLIKRNLKLIAMITNM